MRKFLNRKTFMSLVRKDSLQEDLKKHDDAVNLFFHTIVSLGVPESDYDKTTLISVISKDKTFFSEGVLCLVTKISISSKESTFYEKIEEEYKKAIDGKNAL